MADEGLALDGINLNNFAGGTWVMAEFNCPPPKKRVDFVQSDSHGSALVREPLYENRVITIKLEMRTQAASIDLALDSIGALVDKIEEASKNDDGIPLVWTPANSARTVSFDVLVGEITDLPITIDSGWLNRAPSLTIELTCKPFWRGAQVTSGEITSTLPMLTMFVGPIPGDAPAEATLNIRDTSNQSRDDVEWGIEQKFYNIGSPTTLTLESSTFVLSGIGVNDATGTPSGKSGGSTVKALLPPIPALICGLNDQPHVGTFRIKARIWCNSSQVYLRLAWRDGDGPLFSNNWISPLSTSTFSEVDLGTITIGETPIGTQRWTGQIEAYSQIIAAAELHVDYILLIPAGEAYGHATAPSTTDRTLLVAQDSFNQTSGALTGKALSLGGTWATAGGSTDADDFQVQPAFGLISRVAASDSAAHALNTGRIDLAGTTVLTGTDVRVDFTGDPTGNNAGKYGLVARFVDTSNFVVAYTTMISTGSGGSPPNVGACYLSVAKVVAGTVTQLGTSAQFPAITQWSTLRFWIDNAGRFAAIRDLQVANFAPLHVAIGQDSALATGGALDDGKVGIFDQNVSAGTAGRFFDNFSVYNFDRQPVLYASKSLFIRHDDVLRENAAGYYGRPPSYRGARFRLPPGGDQARAVRLVVKARRNVLDEFPDTVINDGIAVSATYTPRGIAVPR